MLCHHNPSLAGHERNWPSFQVVLSGRSAGDGPLFHTLPSRDRYYDEAALREEECGFVRHLKPTECHIYLYEQQYVC